MALTPSNTFQKGILAPKFTLVDTILDKEVSLDDMRHPETDEERVANEKFIVLVGVCTHLGCVPLGQKSGDVKGQYGGWFCPCHGSHYDHSGRIRKGPAPTNLEVPSYEFLSDNIIKIG